MVELQVNVEDPPAATLVGLALTVTLSWDTTVTVAEAFAEPPVPVQVMV